jgi:hypothetical protein
MNNKMELVDMVNCMEYVRTYQDNDGNWILISDVPWK